MLKILFSDKDDWKMKSEGRYDKALYDFNYANLTTIKSLKGYDIVIPLYEKDIHALNNRFAAWGHKFIVAPNDVVDFCNDKLKFNLHLTEIGFENNIPKILTAPTQYPYILKKNFDEWGLNSHIIDGVEKENSLSDILNHPDYFKQAYVIGKDEYATHFIFSENKLQYCQTFKFTFPKEIFIKGFESPPFKTAVIIPVESDFSDLFEKILQQIDFKGVGCFNFKIENNLPKIFELNPRVGGSLPLDLINFLEAYKSCCEAQNSSSWTRIKKFFL
jgi:predicted ATP-grasp superfamily ATP-dependent carboligase